MNPITRAAFVALLAVSLPAAAADHRESRSVGDFTEVGLSAPIDVHVSIGSSPSLTLEGDADTIARIETVVEAGRLKIRTPTQSTRWPSSTMKAERVIAMPTAAAR